MRLFTVFDSEKEIILKEKKNMFEERVFINGKVKLGTTITHVDDSKESAAIIILMGSGTMDRDGNGFGIKTDMYKNLAEEFAKRGLKSLYLPLPVQQTFPAIINAWNHLKMMYI